MADFSKAKFPRREGLFDKLCIGTFRG